MISADALPSVSPWLCCRFVITFPFVGPLPSFEHVLPFFPSFGVYLRNGSRRVSGTRLQWSVSTTQLTAYRTLSHSLAFVRSEHHNLCPDPLPPLVVHRLLGAPYVSPPLCRLVGLTL